MFYVLITHEGQSLYQLPAYDMRKAVMTKLQIESNAPYLCIVRYQEGGEVSSTDVILALRSLKAELEGDLKLLQEIDLDYIPNQQSRILPKSLSLVKR